MPAPPGSSKHLLVFRPLPVQLPCSSIWPLLKKSKLKLQMLIIFIYSTNDPKPHSCGDKGLTNNFQLSYYAGTTLRLKTALKPYFVQDQGWNIVLFHNHDIL